MYSKLFQHNFHLDPAPDGAAGGAANPSLPATGDAAPAFDASQFVPKADFDRVNSEFGEFRQTAEQRFQDYDSRLPKPVKAEPKEDKEPDFESGEYDANKPGEIQRYFRELAAYNFKQQFSQREKQYAEHKTQKEYDDSVKGAQDAHYARQDSYKILNPDYDPFAKIGFGNEAVALAVLESDFSANIHHYLQKNVDKKIELQKLSYDNPRAALRMIGRLESQFETQNTAIPGKKAAASASVTTAGFGGGNPAGKPKESFQEIFDRHHK